MIATARHVNRLAQQARESRYRIGELVQATALNIGDAVAWGQFLDDSRQVSQFGFYGTSAAIEILTIAGMAPDNRLIRQAWGGVPDASSPTSKSPAYDLADLGITFKLAALVDAEYAGRQSDNLRPFERLLKSKIIDGRGWGYYYYDDDDRDTSPKFLATAQAMYSLRHSRIFKTSADAEHVTAWICRELSEDADLQPDELALAVLALADYQGFKSAVHEFDAAHDMAVSRLLNWAGGRQPQVIGESRSYHYSVREKAGQRNHYVFYPTDILVALALIQAGNPQATREYTLDVVRYASTNVKANGGLRARSSHRIATVDQLWASRLFDAFEAAVKRSPRNVVPRVAQVVSHTRIRQALTALALLAIGLAGTAISIDADIWAWLRVAGGVAAAVMLGVLATAIWKWIGGK
ncbi:hypothetical protein O7635_08610 [Asanoa sp. WMMD1127]|uniref:hypothetical protein n=1 Tax=Asanoa sp. WMMD1127 TaxID=3016107 RepID=UPI002417DDDB|nr:hypothetical protein [Asanoa sp. WMMD1127]MDG4821913.1 hypothetical protein [Asanoa sp. WMMD1127]